MACADIAIAMAASVALADVLMSRLLSLPFVALCFVATMPSIALNCQYVDIRLRRCPAAAAGGHG
jgi:hypothetical protein